jgi:hypothetical protein
MFVRLHLNGKKLSMAVIPVIAESLKEDDSRPSWEKCETLSPN